MPEFVWICPSLCFNDGKFVVTAVEPSCVPFRYLGNPKKKHWINQLSWNFFEVFCSTHNKIRFKILFLSKLLASQSADLSHNNKWILFHSTSNRFTSSTTEFGIEIVLKTHSQERWFLVFKLVAKWRKNWQWKTLNFRQKMRKALQRAKQCNICSKILF